MNRRKFIAASAAGASVALAGCIRPDPEVVETSAESQLLGPTTIRAVVENEGRSGDVIVTLTIYNEEGTVLDTYTKTVSIEQDQRREVEFDVNLEQGAARYSVTAEPAGPL